jgi:hypothetical protein
VPTWCTRGFSYFAVPLTNAAEVASFTSMASMAMAAG